jgi:hypothetical protein
MELGTTVYQLPASSSCTSTSTLMKKWSFISIIENRKKKDYNGNGNITASAAIARHLHLHRSCTLAVQPETYARVYQIKFFAISKAHSLALSSHVVPLFTHNKLSRSRRKEIVTRGDCVGSKKSKMFRQPVAFKFQVSRWLG